MVAHQVGDALPAGAAVLRNEPVQARSTARLSALLNAAAAVIDEIGYERLTTAMVAEKAGASIGTVYRYFPDRIAVLQSLSARNLAEFSSRGLAGAANATDWTSLFGAVSSPRVWTERLCTVSPVASSSRRARSANPSMPIELYS